MVNIIGGGVAVAVLFVSLLSIPVKPRKQVTPFQGMHDDILNSVYPEIILVNNIAASFLYSVSYFTPGHFFAYFSVRKICIILVQGKTLLSVVLSVLLTVV